MPETGGEAPFLFQKSYGVGGGQGWQGGSKETSGEKSHMGKRMWPTAPSPSEPPLPPPLWAQRSADPGSKAAHLLCTPRILSSRISHEDLLAWLGWGAVLGTCLFCRARELILRGKGGGHLPGMESSLDLTQ